MNMQSIQSEVYGAGKIRDVFASVFPNTRILTNIILPMENSKGCPTAEFDVIVICEAGVFVFEIKGYNNGKIKILKSPGGDSREWFFCKDDAENKISDPLIQGGRKIKYLRESISNCMVRGYVYFTGDKIELPPTISPNVVKTEDLGFLCRILRNDAKKKNGLLSPGVIDHISESIAAISKNHSIDEHIFNCKKTEEYKRKIQEK